MTYINNFIRNDAPEPWQLGLQDSASPISEGILRIHNEIIYYLIIILVSICWIIISIIIRYNESSNKFQYKYLNHGTIIELIWTITPALILIAIAIPSFKLLYLMDEVIEPTITLKLTGHQWYWSTEYSDYVNERGNLEFDSYMTPESDLELGDLRLLEVDNRLILPIDTHVRILVTSADVIHSLALPSLGVKIDCIPGRLNQTSFLMKREGVYYGQCSELCGIAHGFMPIVVEGVSLEKYLVWINEGLGPESIGSDSSESKILASIILLSNRIMGKILSCQKSLHTRLYSTKKNNANKIYQDIWLGIKKGYSIDIIPPKLRKIHDSLLVRALRVIGGISLIICVGGYNFLPTYSLYFAWPIGCLFFFYQIFIQYHSAIHIFKLWKSGELEVRNSPVNKFASVLSHTYVCLKWGCAGGGVAATGLGAGLGIDSLLEENGRPKVFTPWAAKHLDRGLTYLGYPNPNTKPIEGGIADTYKELLDKE